jgi:hypothetical protein
VADINFIGTYTSANFQFASGSGGKVEITDPAASLQAALTVGTTLSYSPIANINADALKPNAGQFANIALFSQYTAGQVALAPAGEHSPTSAPAVSGSTALLAHGHG